MFSTWQKEKAVIALVDAAQQMADKLAATKPHILDSHAATAQFWAAHHAANGLDLTQMSTWKPAAVTRFANATATQIAALRKQREYDSSDGLAVWLHTARAMTEPRILPAARHIWNLLLTAGPNAPVLTQDLLAEAGLNPDPTFRLPKGLLD
jgi:hypothetical protein